MWQSHAETGKLIVAAAFRLLLRVRQA